MTNCPQCGVPAVDGSRFCKECGYQFAPVAACPQCGAPLAGGAAFCEQCGCNLAAQATPAQVSQPTIGGAAVSPQPPIQPPHPQVAQPAPQPNPGNPQPAKSGDNSSGKTVLIAVLVALILLLLGGAGWAVYTGKLNLEGNSLANRSETETETSNATSAENDNTLDVTSEAASDDEPIETTDETPEPEDAAPKQSEVYMSMWGTIGDSEEVDFEMSGTSGWYSYKRKGVTGPKRTLKLKSFDSMSRRCVIDAFLNGKYIGHFDGKFIDDEVDIGDGDTKSVQSYDGAFISVKGLKIDFYLYCD